MSIADSTTHVLVKVKCAVEHLGAYIYRLEEGHDKISIS